MKTYKKTFWGSIAAFFLGTSCCWISSLAIWLGGATLLGTLAGIIENAQVLFIISGVILGIVSLFLFFKKRKEERSR